MTQPTNECDHLVCLDGRCAACQRPVVVAPLLPALEHRLGSWPGLETSFDVTITAAGVEVDTFHVCPCGACSRLVELDELTNSLCPDCHASRKALA